MQKSWHTGLARLSHTLFAPACPFCQAPLGFRQLVCEECLAALPILPDVTLDPAFTVAYAFQYASPIRELILAVKFAKSLPETRLLGELVAQHLAPRIRDKPEIIIPAPLHHRRLRQRGFNQALELAKPLARSLGCPISSDYVIRSYHTVAQSTLSAKDRLKNTQNAFAIKQPIPYRHVALFDDVITTGATLGAMKQLLHTAGVERVDFYACARPLS